MSRIAVGLKKGASRGALCFWATAHGVAKRAARQSWPWRCLRWVNFPKVCLWYRIEWPPLYFDAPLRECMFKAGAPRACRAKPRATNRCNAGLAGSPTSSILSPAK